MTAPALLLRPRGALDWEHCDELRTQLATAFATGVRSIAVDLSGVTAADVTGLQVLAGAARHLRKRDGLLVVTKAPPFVVSLMKINGMSDLLEVPAAQPLRVVARTEEPEREQVSVDRKLRVIRPEPA